MKRYTLAEAFAALADCRPGETLEDREKRMAKIRRYANERDALEAEISVLSDDPTGYEEKLAKKQKRLAAVREKIATLC